jgi:hypothetical protein
LYALKYLLINLNQNYDIGRFAQRAWDVWRKQSMETAGQRIFVLDPLKLPTAVKFEPVNVSRVWEQVKDRVSNYGIRIKENETLRQVVQYIGEAYNSGIKRMLEQRLENLRRTLNNVFETTKNQLVRQKGHSSFEEMPEEEKKDIVRRSKAAAADKLYELRDKMFLGTEGIANSVDTKKIMDSIVEGLRERFSIALKSGNVAGEQV